MKAETLSPSKKSEEKSEKRKKTQLCYAQNATAWDAIEDWRSRCLEKTQSYSMSQRIQTTHSLGRENSFAVVVAHIRQKPSTWMQTLHRVGEMLRNRVGALACATWYTMGTQGQIACSKIAWEFVRLPVKSLPGRLRRTRCWQLACPSSTRSIDR